MSLEQHEAARQEKIARLKTIEQLNHLNCTLWASLQQLRLCA